MTFLVTKSFFLLLIVGSILPSDGNHGLLAPKTLAFLNAFFWFNLFFASRGKLLSSQVWSVLFTMMALSFFGIWYVVGINQSPLIPSGQFDQFKVFMTTIFVPVAAWYLIKEKIINGPQIIRTVTYANFIYCGIKISLMGMHLLKIINVWTVMHKTGLRFMSMNILGELGRIQTSVDILTPFLVYFVLQSDNLNLKFSKKFIWLFTIVGLLSTFLSFSRLLIFAFGISIILHGITLRATSQLKMWVACIILAAGGIMVAGPEKVQKVVEKRLFSTDNYQSDATRRVQIEALMNGCDESPILGKGLGGYTTECIRDHQLPHAYEVQWVAFLMQFGLIGIFIILIPIVMITWKLIVPPFSRPLFGFFMLFGLWLTSGFTNPFMISLTSGIIYTLFLIAGMRTAAYPPLLVKKA